MLTLTRSTQCSSSVIHSLCEDCGGMFCLDPSSFWTWGGWGLTVALFSAGAEPTWFTWKKNIQLVQSCKIQPALTIKYTFIVSILGLLKHDGYLNGWTVFFWSLLFLSSFGFSTSSRIYLVIVIIWFLHPEQIVISTKGFVDISYKIGLSRWKNFPCGNIEWLNNAVCGITAHTHTSHRSE